MRRGEETRAQTRGVADRCAHRGRTALAVRTAHDNRLALQPPAIDTQYIEQFAKPRQADAVAIFRQVKHYNNPIARNVCCQMRRIRSSRPDSSSSRIDGFELISITVI